MQPKADAKANQAAEVKATPPIRPKAPWRVVYVAVPAHAHLHVKFVDGTEGEVDMSKFLEDRSIEGTVFAPLRDPAVFARASVVMGAVQWPNGADVSPDAMHDEIEAKGRWVVE